jgi:hypothetical protein
MSSSITAKLYREATGADKEAAKTLCDVLI